MYARIFLAFWLGSFCDWYVEEDMARIEPCHTQQRRIGTDDDESEDIP